jgi:hypothetical protein
MNWFPMDSRSIDSRFLRSSAHFRDKSLAERRPEYGVGDDRSRLQQWDETGSLFGRNHSATVSQVQPGSKL